MPSSARRAFAMIARGVSWSAWRSAAASPGARSNTAESLPGLGSDATELPRAKVAADIENKTVGPGLVVLTEPRHAAVRAGRAFRRERPVAIERDLDADGRHAVG